MSISINDLQKIDVTDYPILHQCTAHEDASNRYRQIPTASMVHAIEQEGWIPHQVVENKVLKPSRDGFQTHRVLFHNPDLPTVNGSIPRIMLTNSHDAKKSYQIAIGILRFVCANGMLVSTNWSDYKVKHTGNAINDALEATKKLTANASRVAASIEGFSSIQVNRDLRLAFNREAAKLRYDEKLVEIEPTAKYLDNPNRHADQENDLWSLYNRVQENLIRGKHRYLPKKTEENAWPTSKKAREIKAFEASDKINKGLWELAERFAAPNGQQLDMFV